VLEGETVRGLTGDIFAGSGEITGELALSEVRLLVPCAPSKVIAVGLNYRSHLKGRPEPEYPGLFAVLPSAVVGPEDEIVIPPDAGDVHYEGELVVVIGKQAKNVPAAGASDFVFGVTAGNDVSERNWQRSDLQWVRAKASDSFAPVGPAIATDLDYNDLLVETRLNGELRQSERTSDLIFDVETIVAFISRYVTLLPGDLIFTGTPGTTEAMRAGDVVEVEVEGVGVLRNTVAASD
jgi:2-keto-4-pentenoate hydratase/2-oxohepta-3-ene-1,7-dioic acid hydratase in catechol pathway